MSTREKRPLSTWWRWGVMAYESPRPLPADEVAIIFGDGGGLTPEQTALRDGYRARSAAQVPVPQKPEYRQPKRDT